MKSIDKSNNAISQQDYWISKPRLNVCILFLLEVPMSVWRSEENLAGVSSLSTVWVLGMDLRSPGWMASAFTAWAISLALCSEFFTRKWERINNRIPVI